MKRGLFLLLLVCVTFLPAAEKAAAQDSTSHITSDTAASRSQSDSTRFALVDTAFFNSAFKWWRWPSVLGGDLFLTVDYPVTHQSYTSAEVGYGAEIRVAPVFVGGIIGLSDVNGSALSYWSLYGGASFAKYRIEVGGTRAPQNQYNGTLNNTALFLGISRRIPFAYIFLVEPEVRVTMPVVETFLHPIDGGPPRDGYLVTQHFGLRYLYLGFTVKLGIGYN